MALCFGAFSLLFGQNTGKTVPSSGPSNQNAMMAMPSVAPIFLEGAGFSSTLNLVNDTLRSFEAQVDLYSLDGIRVARKVLTIPPFGLKLVRIHDLLQATEPSMDIGSIRVSSTHSGDGLLAALALSHYGTTETYFDEELAMPTMDGSNTLRAVADSGEATIVAITSIATSVQHLTVSCMVENGVPITRVMELLPGQTLLQRPCSPEHAELLLSASDVATYPTGFRTFRTRPRSAGISITTDGMPGELAAYGIVPHITRSDAFFTALNFTDPKLKKSGGAVYNGIPVGPSPLLSEGDYLPEISLANFGLKAASVTIESAVTLSGKPETRTLATFSLARGEVKTLHLDQMPRSPDLRASVLVHTDAPTGDLLTKLISRGESMLPAVEMLDKEISNGPNGGGHPWSTGGGVTSVLLLFNHDPKEQLFNVRFGDTSGKNPWMKKYKLASMETLAININDLIASQEKDDNGNKLLIKLKAGEVGWQSDSPKAAGRVLQADPLTGMARNFSCSDYYSVCSPSIAPSILELALDQTGPWYGSWGWNLSHFGYSTSCSCSNPTSSSGSVSLFWSTANNSIASISSGGSSSTSQWFGQAGGQTSGTFQVVQPNGGPSCQVQEPAQVATPTSLKGPTIAPFQTYSNQTLSNCNGTKVTDNFYGVSSCGSYTVLIRMVHRFRPLVSRLTSSSPSKTRMQPERPLLRVGQLIPAIS